MKFPQTAIFKKNIINCINDCKIGGKPVSKKTYQSGGNTLYIFSIKFRWRTPQIYTQTDFCKTEFFIQTNVFGRQI